MHPGIAADANSNGESHQVSKINLRPLPLALAFLFAPFHQAAAADANSSTSIPLDLIQENYGGGQFGYRLGVNVGVNGATPEEYLFDTGSDSFNIDVGLGALNGQSPAWFPNEPGAVAGPLQFYLYGDGTYGYVQSSTTVASMQFYNSANGNQVASYATAQGAPVAVNYAYVTSTATGPSVGTANGVTLNIDETFQQNLANGVAPEEGYFYGIMGAGDFGNGVPGMLTNSGYIVEANGTGKAPGACGNACLIEGLTPALRAQFLSVVPWIGGAQGTFALSGAPSASQFDTMFAYTLSQGGQTVWSATYPTLFDTGTPNIMLIDNDDGFQPGTALNPGITLTATGVAPNAQPSSVVSGDPNNGDYTNVVGIGPYGGFPDGAIYGISFFMHNAVMYDLANKSTAYTPFFVTAAPITTGFAVTADMGPLGLAGTISGAGPLQIAAGGIADLSGTNTYTGATVVAQGGWLALAGPGSIAASSDVHVDGIFDISRTWQNTTVQSLSGSGNVLLGDATLDLTNASGTFAGQLADGGIGGGAGGHFIVSAGKEALTGNNTFTGPTGVAAPATLDVEGSLAGSAINLGVLIDNGSIRGAVLDNGLLLGQGSIGGNLVVNGVVAPGNRAASLQTLNVGGNFAQGAGSTFLAQFDPATGASSRIAVSGSAILAPGARIAVAPIAGTALYQAGTRYTVLDAGNGLDGTYTLAGQNMLSAVLGIVPAYDAQHAYLDVVQTRAFDDAARTANQRDTLDGVQSLSGLASAAGQAESAGIRPQAWRAVAMPAAGGPAPAATLYTVLANLPTDAALRAVADQLSGEIHATTQGVLLEDSRYVRDAVAGRLRQAGEGASGPSVQDDQGKLAWWGQFVGSWGHRDSDGNAASTKHTSGGFMLGADRPLGDRARLGVAAGYTQTAVNTAARGSSASSRDLDLSVYAGAQFGGLGLRAGAAYGWHTLDGTRFIAVPGLLGHELSRYDAGTAQVFGEAGYRFAFRHASLEPFVQAAHVRLRTDGFQEHDGAADLSGQGESHSVSFSTLGARAASNFALHGGQELSLHAMLGWRRAYGRVGTATSMAFAGGESFVVQGLPIARNAAAVDAGLTVQLAKHASFDLSWQGQFSHHAADSGFRGSFDWEF